MMWQTWLFVGTLSVVAVGLLWLWTRTWRTWVDRLPEADPVGWTPWDDWWIAEKVEGGDFGREWLSDSDPGAAWHLYWELTDRLVAVRRVRVPPPRANLSASLAQPGLVSGYESARVLLEGMMAERARIVRRSRMLEGEPGGAYLRLR